MPLSDHYSVLGVRRGATLAQIQKAFRSAAREVHPDKNPQGEGAFKQLNEAYCTLSDRGKRATYDVTLLERESTPRGGPPGMRAAAAATSASDAPHPPPPAAASRPSASWFFTSNEGSPGAHAPPTYTPMSSVDRAEIERSVRAAFQKSHGGAAGGGGGGSGSGSGGVSSPCVSPACGSAEPGRRQAREFLARTKQSVLDGLDSVRQKRRELDAQAEEAAKRRREDRQQREASEAAAAAAESAAAAARRDGLERLRQEAAGRRAAEKEKEIRRLRELAQAELLVAKAVRDQRMEGGGGVPAAPPPHSPAGVGRGGGGGGGLLVPSDEHISHLLGSAELLRLADQLSDKLRLVRQVYLQKQ